MTCMNWTVPRLRRQSQWKFILDVQVRDLKECPLMRTSSSFGKIITFPSSPQNSMARHSSPQYKTFPSLHMGQTTKTRFSNQHITVLPMTHISNRSLMATSFRSRPECLPIPTTTLALHGVAISPNRCASVLYIHKKYVIPHNLRLVLLSNNCA